jgi:hypothetical protein
LFLGEIAAYCRPVTKAEPAIARQLAVLFFGASDLDRIHQGISGMPAV